MTKYCVGLMSGTSLDGIDAALMKIEGSGKQIKIELLDFNTYPLPASTREKIFYACSIEKSQVDLICSLNFELGHLFADAVKNICKKSNFPIEKLDFIGSHGQTIWHIPFKTDLHYASTLQIGEPAVIAFETGATVISNFRTMDIAAGGQGAPLVPFTEYLLYNSESTGRIFQNIGGIGNLTVLPAGCSLDEIQAFDTGPGNMIIDQLCRIFKNTSYDPQGSIAASGKIVTPLLNYMMSENFFNIAPPKSTGRELFGEKYVNNIIKAFPDISGENFIATATYFTALSIAFHYEKYIFPFHKISEVIVSGGGAYNKTIMKHLKGLLHGIKVITGDDFGINSSAKEAIAFGLLANETLYGNPSNVPSATGAKKQVVLGNITKIEKSIY